MYKLASALPPALLRRGRFLCNVLLFLFVLTSATAAKDTLAILPFTGGQGEDGETIAELFSFQKDLIAIFSPVPRTSINRAIRNEQGFQMESGMTDPDTIASLGKQLGAKYVVAGTIARLGSQNLLVIAILHTETLQQIAGDIETYRTIEEIDAKLPAMARNVAAAVQKDTSKLPLLAIPPVRLAGGADSREADALAQILAARLVRSGAYAVYPRTKSLEQVQEEYGHEFNGDTADEYLPNIGRAGNPRLVLSVTARRLGSRSMFNAAIINLESGIQEAGDTVDYQSLSDGVDAMEELALKLTDPKKAAELAAAKARAEREARAEQEAAAKAEQERLAAAARARAAQEAAAKADQKVAARAWVVSDAASFTQAIAAINNDKTGGDYAITLNGSFASSPVAFTGNASKTITLKGDAGARTISNNGGGALFTVPKGITLVLENNVTLNGNNQKNSVVRVNGGTLSMKAGSTVRGAQNSGDLGGGVYVVSGAFTMSGGTISGNSANGGGGGVCVGSGGAFTMSGGAISGNSTSNFGGGVYAVGGGGAFAISGGAISGNTATHGGGVCVGSGGAFTMSGGTINGNSTSGNSTSNFGGGVYVVSGAFTMSGGAISGNTATHGGGVCVIGNRTFIKSGGGTIDAANSAKEGKVAYVFDGNKKRDAAAGPSVNLDSRVSGSAGGWE